MIMNKKLRSLGAVLVAAVLVVGCNDGNDASTEEDMDTNLTDTRRNTTDTMQTLPDTATMKIDTFQPPQAP